VVLDTAVGEQVLRALTPAAIELSLTAAGDLDRERARKEIVRALIERVTVTMAGNTENFATWRTSWAWATTDSRNGSGRAMSIPVESAAGDIW